MATRVLFILFLACSAIPAQVNDSTAFISTYAGIYKSYELNQNIGKYTFDTYGSLGGFTLSKSHIQLQLFVHYSNLNSNQLSKLYDRNRGGYIFHTNVQLLYQSSNIDLNLDKLENHWYIGTHVNHNVFNTPNLDNNTFSHNTMVWIHLKWQMEYSLDLWTEVFSIAASVYHNPWALYTMKSDITYSNRRKDSWWSRPWLDGFRSGLELRLKWLTRIPWGIAFRWDYEKHTQMYAREFEHRSIMLFYDLDF